MSSAALVKPRRRFLHAGCGTFPLPFENCDELRLDADPAVKPDVVRSMTDLGELGEFDGVYCSHALEHLHPQDALTALREFHRVLIPGGFVTIIVPDLEGISPTFDLLPGMMITGHDLIYGLVDLHNPLMLHRTGFIAETMRGALKQAGFRDVIAKRLPNYNLLGLGIK
jgi:SAM-dependent methyltransferase